MGGRTALSNLLTKEVLAVIDGVLGADSSIQL